jgi:hypothetical protein
MFRTTTEPGEEHYRVQPQKQVVLSQPVNPYPEFKGPSKIEFKNETQAAFGVANSKKFHPSFGLKRKKQISKSNLTT